MPTIGHAIHEPLPDLGAERDNGLCVMKATLRISFVLLLLVASVSLPGRVAAAIDPAWLAGWFVDRTATVYAGADDVEVFAGTTGNRSISECWI